MAQGTKRHSIKEYFTVDEAGDLATGTSVLLTPDSTPTKADSCSTHYSDNDTSSEGKQLLDLPDSRTLVRSLSDSLLDSPKLPVKVTKCDKHCSTSVCSSAAVRSNNTKGSSQNKGRKSRAKKQTAKSKATKSRALNTEKSDKHDGRSSSVPASDRKNSLTRTTLVTDYFPIRRSSRVTSKDLKNQKQSDIEEAILSGCEDGLKTVDFEGKGRGIVASKPFKRGDFVVEYSGDTIDLASAKRRELAYTDNPEYGCYMYYFKYKNQSYCIDATAETDKLGRLLNHSKANRNCATKVVGIDNKPYLILVTIRDISEGEELLYDYGDRSKSSLEAHPWLAL